ncbi:MAG: hypothetical protein AAF899_02775 [Pseudomonadota bacterium]
MTIEKAIIVDEEQLAALTGGGATWLMQRRRWNYRGRIGLVVRGSGAVSAVAEMADCLEAIENATGMASAAGHHGLDADAQKAALEAGATVPWVLAGVMALPTPVSFEQGRAPGPNINLDAVTGAAVVAAAGGAPATAAPPAEVPTAKAPATPAKPTPAKPKPTPAATKKPEAAPKPAAASTAKPAAKPKPEPSPEPAQSTAARGISWIRRIFIGD